jgi:PAS domain-containing protein
MSESPPPTELEEPAATETGAPDQPLELILARNLISIISLAALLIDSDGNIVFFNDAAAEIVGSPFEEIGTMPQDEWNARYGPLDENGEPLPAEELPLRIAIREGRPAYARFRIRGDAGLLEVEAGALPLLGPAGYHGAIVVFWAPDVDPGAG